MSKGKRFAARAGAIVGLYLVALVLGVVVVRPADAVGSPSHSRLRLVEELFPPRHLTAADIRRGGRSCLDGNSLVVPPGGGCTFIVPPGVHVVVFRRAPSSSPMIITLSQTMDLTQTADSARPGPDQRDPLRLRFAVIHDGTTVTLSSCRGPGYCRIDLSR